MASKLLVALFIALAIPSCMRITVTIGGQDARTEQSVEQGLRNAPITEKEKQQ